jgi:hypothetical protein
MGVDELSYLLNIMHLIFRMFHKSLICT